MPSITYITAADVATITGYSVATVILLRQAFDAIPISDTSEDARAARHRTTEVRRGLDEIKARAGRASGARG